MALDFRQKNAFNRQIDRMKEDGFFLPARRSLAGDARYLFVSYGGSGAAALFSVKKQLENALPGAQMEERIRFLAIDSDIESKKETRRVTNPDGTSSIEVVDNLNNGQFVHLSGRHAGMCLHDDAVAQWLNPVLKNRIEHDWELLSGCGASGSRQLGRLSLYPAITVEAVSSRVQKLAAELTAGNDAPLHVFILSGISGGTGSGIVVDATYLIRNALEEMPGNVSVRTRYCGFLLLPPTENSADPVMIGHSNRNGYAALKEITHFMTIGTHNGSYRMTYGNGKTVTSQKNLFDTCYLIDGMQGLPFAYISPREHACRVLAASVLDIVTSSAVANGGFAPPPHNAFVGANSIHTAPRDADYIYCALGLSAFEMPMHEIKAYVAKQMFDRIHKLFLNCSNVGSDDAHTLLKEIAGSSGGTADGVARAMDAALYSRFTNMSGGWGGPFYVINLLRELVNEIHVQRSKMRLFRVGLVTDQVLDLIGQYALHMNDTVFSVLAAATDVMKSLFDEQFVAVVKGGVNGNTYSFLPDSMGPVDGSECIIQYLDGLISRNTLRQLTEAMLQEMIGNKAEWTALTGNDDSTAAPNAMRRFWNEQLDKIINFTLEDFLIKHYAQYPEASYSIETHVYLQKAAKAIYDSMLGYGGSAHPMVGLTHIGLQPRDLNARTVLTVPGCAPNLYRELANIAVGAPAGLQVQFSTGSASDRISCCKQYTSIPAFKLDWACCAELDYEQTIMTFSGVGIHLSEAAGDGNWKVLPNLLPRSCWHLAPRPGYGNPREAILADRAAELFDQAKKLGMVAATPHIADPRIPDYRVMILPGEFRPDDALFRELDSCVPNSAQYRQLLAAIDRNAQQHAGALFSRITVRQANAALTVNLANAGVAFETRNLFFSDSVRTVGPTDELPENWGEHLAKCTLRRMPDVMNEVRGTVAVLKLITLIAQGY